MIAVEVNVRSNFERKLENFERRQPGRILTKEISDEIISNMKALVPFWHGNLQKSINAKVKENGYSIMMNFYGRFVEEGTRPHLVSDKNYLLKAWAASKNINYGLLRFIIERHGTKAHPFVEPSIRYALAKFDDTAMFLIKKTLKESGFSEKI